MPVGASAPEQNVVPLPGLGRIAPPRLSIYPPVEQQGPPLSPSVKAARNLQPDHPQYLGMPPGYEPQTSGAPGLIPHAKVNWGVSPDETRFLTPQQQGTVTPDQYQPAPLQGHPVAQAIGGAMQGGTRAAQGLTDYMISPENLVLTGLTGGTSSLAPLAGAIISGGFLSDMATQAPDLYDHLVRSAEDYGKTGNAENLIAAVTEAAGSGYFAYGMGKHVADTIGQAVGNTMRTRANERAIPGAMEDLQGSVDNLRDLRDRTRAQREGVEQLEPRIRQSTYDATRAVNAADMADLEQQGQASGRRSALQIAADARKNAAGMADLEQRGRDSENRAWQRSVAELAPSPPPDGSGTIPVEPGMMQALLRDRLEREQGRRPATTRPVSPVFEGEASPRARGPLEDLELPPLPEQEAQGPAPFVEQQGPLDMSFLDRGQPGSPSRKAKRLPPPPPVEEAPPPAEPDPLVDEERAAIQAEAEGPRTGPLTRADWDAGIGEWKKRLEARRLEIVDQMGTEGYVAEPHDPLVDAVLEVEKQKARGQYHPEEYRERDQTKVEDAKRLIGYYRPEMIEDAANGGVAGPANRTPKTSRPRQYEPPVITDEDRAQTERAQVEWEAEQAAKAGPPPRRPLREVFAEQERQRDNARAKEYMTQPEDAVISDQRQFRRTLGLELSPQEEAQIRSQVRLNREVYGERAPVEPPQSAESQGFKIGGFVNNPEVAGEGPKPEPIDEFSPEASERRRVIEEQDAAARKAAEDKIKQAEAEKLARPEIKGKQIGLMGEDDRGLKGDQMDLMGEPEKSGAGRMTGALKEGLYGGRERADAAARRPTVEEPSSALRAVTDFKKAVDDNFMAGTSTEVRRAMGGSLRAHAAEADRQIQVARRALKQGKIDVGALSDEDGLHFADLVEDPENYHGKLPEKFEGYAAAVRPVLDTPRDAIRSWGEGYLQHFYENYLPHAWKNVGKAEEYYKGKRTLEGAKSFLKRRSIETTRAGIEAGLEPVFPNPLDAVLWRAEQMHKFILGHEFLRDADLMGQRTFVPAEKPHLKPAGWVFPDDPSAEVWGPGKVPIEESFDERLWTDLHKLADAIGTKHTRVAPKPGGPLGVELPPGDRIATKFASSLGTLTHELGHAIDDKFGAWDFITKPEPVTRSLKDGSVAENKAASQKQRAQIAKELRALADMRDTAVDRGLVEAGSKEAANDYLRKKTEKMANMVDAYVNHRALMNEVAPTVLRRFEELIDANPKLKPLKDMRPSLVRTAQTMDMPTGGPVLLGRYAVPKDVANLLDNYLKPGLEGNGAFRGYRALSNSVVQAKLGASAFHATFSGVTASVDALAAAMKYAEQGQIGRAAKLGVEGVIPGVSVVKRALEGSKIRARALAGESDPIIEALVQGGHRFANEYSNGAVQKFREAVAAHEFGTAAARAPFAAVEMLAKPIMEHLVPNLKTGAMAQLARLELSRLGPEANPSEVRWALGRAQDSVDNRFGQLIRDNLFFKKAVRDLMGVVVQAPGWNIGDIRELGGAAVDLATAPVRGMRAKVAGEEAATRRERIAELQDRMPEEGEEGGLDREQRAELKKLQQRDALVGRGLHDGAFTHRMAFTAALPVLVGLWGGILNRVMTGENPKELKDYFFPRTGNKRPDGSDERLTLPTYMKDVYSFFLRPRKTIEGKLHPLPKSLVEIPDNRDSSGTQIWNPDDPWYRIAGDVGKHLAKTYEPISVSNYEQSKDASETPAQRIGAFAGVPRAPKYITETPAEREISRYQEATRGQEPRTKQQAEAGQTMRQAEQLMRTNRRSEGSAKLREGLQSGTLGQSDVNRFVGDIGRPVLENRFKALPIEEKFKVYDLANAEQKPKMRAMIAQTIMSQLDSGELAKKRPDEIKRIMAKWRAIR